jgi:hypothetical protein
LLHYRHETKKGQESPKEGEREQESEEGEKEQERFCG